MGKRVVVLGAGVIGMAVAQACAEEGHAVTVLERLPRGRDGCSFGNAGMVVPSHFTPLATLGTLRLGLKWMWNPESPLYLRPRWDADFFAWMVRFVVSTNPVKVALAEPVLRDFNLFSREVYEELAGRGWDFGFEKRGLLMLCRTKRGLEEEAHAALRARELGLEADVLDSRGLAAIERGAELQVEGAVHYRGDRHLVPERFVGCLEEDAAARGADLRFGVEVVDWDCTRGRVMAVRTSEGERFEADEFVVCGGAWSDAVVSGLGVRLPMQPGRGYSLTLRKPRQVPDVCSILCEDRVAVTPMSGGLRVGGTMELAGMGRPVNPARVAALGRALVRYYPSFVESDFAGIEPWQGLRPCSPDGLPYLGRTQRWSNVVVATGHAMMGLSLAPGTGRLVAAVIGEREPEVPVELFSPDRFC
jgi:D-amino-acid dehydrogenase